MQHMLVQSGLDACQVNHLLRATDTFSITGQMEQASLLLRTTFEQLLGIGVSGDQWVLVTLPCRLGGLGLKDPLERRPAARVIAHVSFSSHIRV